MTGSTAKRKLTTILYADVAGYSRLTGDDELRTHKEVMSALDYANEAIGDKGGTVLRYAGDAILAEFPSVVSCVNASVDIQSELASRNHDTPDNKKIQLRVGINLGEVLSDRGEIYGDGVNVAARLESIAVPGGICISHKVGAEVTGKIQVEFVDGGVHQLKNITEPIRVMHWHPDGGVPPPTSGGGNAGSAGIIEKSITQRSRMILVVGAVSVLAVVAAAWFMLQPPASPPAREVTRLELPAEPSVAVLPFQTIGGDGTVDYFSNGLTNDLITDLSRFHGLFVSASNSSFAFQGSAVSAEDAAEQLGVRYVLKGSAQHAGNRVRVNVELIDADSGKNLWAERYDRDLADVFEVQDEIVREIVSALTIKVDEVELQRSMAKRPVSLEAYDFVLRGQNLVRENTRAANFESQRMFQLAIEQDPGYALAYTGLGGAVLKEAADGWSNDPAKGFKRAHDLAQAAIGIESHAEGHALLGRAYLLMKHFDLAQDELRRAIEMNPNDAGSFASLGGVNLWTSNLDPAIAAYTSSMRLDPRASPDVFTHLGTALFLKGQYDGALVHLENSAAKAPGDLFTQVMLAATYAKLDRLDDAKEAVGRVRKLHPFFKVAPYRAAFVKEEHGKSLADALVSIGLD